MTKKDLNTVVQKWLEGSIDSWSTFLVLKKAKKYGPALFFLHLSLEKLSKALVVKKTREHSPYSHSLVYLLGRAGVELSEQDVSDLYTISSFNVGSRYPEDKNDFYSKATKEYLLIWEKKANFLKSKLELLLKSS